MHSANIAAPLASKIKNTHRSRRAASATLHLSHQLGGLDLRRESIVPTRYCNGRR